MRQPPRFKPIPFHTLDMGTLLVAHPDIEEAAYEKKVVLICYRDKTKTLGVCINEPHVATFDKIFLGAEPPTNPNIRVLDGGLDDQDHIMILHSPLKDNPLPSWPINDRAEFLIEQEDISPLLMHPSAPHILISVGYFHWHEGALEEEVYAGHWLLHPSQSLDIFSLETKSMWNMMMEHIGGKYKPFAYMPEHLASN